jgi:preprotein translocase subunit SecE
MSVITQTKNYFEGAYHEMRKVTWPTKQQTINYSLFVIAMSIGMMAFLGVLDFLMSLGVEQLIK